MTVQIHAPWQVNDAFEKQTHEQLEKLKTFYQRIERADVYLKNEESDPETGKMVEVRLAVPGNDLFASAQAHEIELALSQAVSKVKRQLIKHKDLLNSH